MSLFSRRRAKRRIVVVTSVAWALALMAGMVNACVLQKAGPGDNWQGQAEPPPVVKVQTLASQAGPSGDASEDTQPCQKLCDSEAWTIVQSQGHGPSDLGHSAVHVGARTPSLASVALLRWSPHDWPPPDRLPVSIRFLRLTL